jgi:hypothetical protein
VSGDFMAQFLAHSKPLVPGADVAGEQVTSDLAAMDARLHDRDHTENADPIRLQDERIARDNKANEVAAVELHPDGGGTYKSDQGAFTANVDRDGTVHFHDAPNFKIEGLGGRFDTTDWIMRDLGNDPYASAKRAFLDRTREQRAEIGMRRETELLKRSPSLMQQHLEQLWATVRDPAERKQTLFQLWDECADTGNAEVVAAADGARQLVVGFIRAKQISYSPAELAALNAKRQSKATFSP